MSSMGVAGRFLLNTATPAAVPNGPGFDVSNRAMRLTASGLADADFIQVQIWVGPTDGIGEGAWADLAHAGQLVTLSTTNTQRIIAVIGQYRVTYGGSASIKCFAQEDTNELDGNVVYPFTQPYTASGGGGGGGFTATVANTATVDSHFTGDTSGGLFTADVNISADAGNIISAHSDGIYAAASGGSGTIPFTAETADFTVATTSHAYGVTVDEGTVTATLPAATTAAGQQYYMIASFGGGAAFQITPDGTDTINGANTTFAVTSLVPLVMYCDGISGWMLIGGA